MDIFSSELKEAFKIISHSKTNVMAKSKLKDLLQGLGIYLSEQDCSDLFEKHLDTEGKESMDFVDFCNFMYNMYLSSPNVADSDKHFLLQQQFSKIDVEQKGYVTREDIQKASFILGRAFQPEDIEQMFEEFGPETQQISFTMYKQVMLS